MRRAGSSKTRRSRNQQDPTWNKFFSDEDRQEARQQEILGDSLSDIGLSVRNINTLERCAIVTIGQLANMKRVDLLNIPNIGESALDECKAALRKLGVKHQNWKRPARKSRKKRSKKST